MERGRSWTRLARDGQGVCGKESNVNWIVLVLSGCFEAVWAVALSKSEGFAHLGPTLVFTGALAASMAGLAFAMRTLPAGTAYAVWVGIGAALTVIYGMVTGSEPASIARIALIGGLVACIIGLKLIGGEGV